jgi:anti-sigma regulatory factor (Ser/Thr protein kinase)
MILLDQEFNGTGEDVDRLHSVLEKVLNGFVLGGSERFHLLLCISEAFTNATQPGAAGPDEARARVQLSYDGTLLRADIEDGGSAGDPDLVQAGDNDFPGPESEGGRGIGLMKKFADKVEIESRRQGGVRVSMFWEFRADKRRTSVRPLAN